MSDDTCGEILWEGKTYQYEGFHDVEWSFISPEALQVPEGTKVYVVRVHEGQER